MLYWAYKGSIGFFFSKYIFITKTNTLFTAYPNATKLTDNQTLVTNQNAFNN
jgi:hypothetical protein